MATIDFVESESDSISLRGENVPKVSVEAFGASMLEMMYNSRY